MSAPLPPTRPTRPIRPTPGPIVVGAHGGRRGLRGVLDGFRLAAAEYDEFGLLVSLGRAERANVRAQLQRESASAIMALGWLALPIFVLLLRMDVLRAAAGLFVGNDVVARSYRWLAFSHALIGASALPAILIARRRRRDPLDRALGLQAVHVSLVLVSATMIAVLGLVARQSTYGFTVAMIVGNLIYHIPHVGRWIYNGFATAIALLFTLGVDHALLGGKPLEPLADVTRLVEILIALALAILAGSVVRRQRVRSIIVEQRLSSLALIDGLTGVASRRRAEELLAAELAVAGPRRPLSLIVLDLDEFKQVNDTYGHNAGDDVLRGVARLLQQRGRLNDTIGRWGGEEFVVLCPDTPVTGALGFAEQLRERIARQEFAGIGQRTAGFGVAEAVAGDTVLTLVERADRALYEAKRAGRNRVREAATPG